jgi:hypothetical protein
MYKKGLRRSRLARRGSTLAVAAALAGGCTVESTTEQTARTEQTSAIQSATSTYHHPGVVNSDVSLNFVKQKIAQGVDPWKTAYTTAVNDTYGSLSYTDHPPTDSSGNVDCGSYSNPDIHCHDQRNDALAAYTDALLWWFSGNQAYANKAIAILNDWANSLVSITDANAVVQASWVGSLYARAAEILRYSNSGWTSAAITKFSSMLSGIIVPLIQNGAPGKNGNWELTCADSMIQIGVFLENTTYYNTGISLWNARVPTYIYLTSDGTHPNMPSTNGTCGTAYCGSGSGYCSTNTATCDKYGYWGQAGRTMVNGVFQETCRDFEHSQLGLAALIHGAETAKVQGNSTLYTNNATRITAGMEFLAKYINQDSPPTTDMTYTTTDTWLCNSGTFSLLSSTGVGPNPLPAWEMAYNEYANREGLSLPQTQALLTTSGVRPMGYDPTRVEAWETLTHVGAPLPGCTPKTCTQLGDNCGTVGDGCGGTLNCGTCSGSQTCGGGGTPNHCGSGSCTPTTCAALNDNCGQVGDGCGGTLNCGTCTGGLYCGGGSRNNVCAADTVAPSAPSELAHAGSSPSGIALHWSASTDNVGVTGYQVFMCSPAPCTPGTTPVATVTTTSYVVTGLSSTTTYYYWVRAIDAAGNASAHSEGMPLTSQAGCEATINSNTYASSTGEIDYTNSGTVAETNPVVSFRLPKNANYASSSCVWSNQVAPGCTAVSCTTSGAWVQYKFTGSLAPGAQIKLKYATQNTSENRASHISVTADSCD